VKSDIQEFISLIRWLLGST